VEEDEIGTARALGHVDYVTCARCGRSTPVREAALVEGVAFDSTSEYEYLCAACQQALADGEVDLPSELS
jgi:ribosomal protein S26